LWFCKIYRLILQIRNFFEEFIHVIFDFVTHVSFKNNQIFPKHCWWCRLFNF
jgi:hypothetical protein